jgi:hypothetical protein
MSDDPKPASRVGRVRSTVDWAFRNRKTGRLTVVQFPNVSLGVFLVASLVRHFVHPTDTPGALLEALVGISLAWWAIDEIVRGVNPWRRFLGAAVLTILIAGRVSR